MYKSSNPGNRYIAQTEAIKENMIQQGKVSVGDRIYVVESKKEYIMDFNNEPNDYVNPTGGGSSVTLQDKQVSYTSNVVDTVTADSGYDGLSSVEVDVSVPIQTKSILIESNGTTLVEPDTQYSAMSSVTVTSNVLPKTHKKYITLNGNSGIYTISPDVGYDSMSEISLSIGTPQKGTVIAMDLNDDGVDEEYLILKKNNDVAEVLLRNTPQGGASVRFGKDYANGALDVFLNTTYYDTMSETAKLAIVDKHIYTDYWYVNRGSEDKYYGIYNDGSSYYITKSAEGSEIVRHIYAIGVSDVLDYLEVNSSMTPANTTMNSYRMQLMFNDNSASIWTHTRGYTGGTGTTSIGVNCLTGGLVGKKNGSAGNVYGVARPVFQIDLSKISWSVVY